MVFRIIIKIRSVYWQIAGHALAKINGVSIGKNCKFYGLPIFSLYPGSTIRIGNRVVLCSDSRHTDLGLNHPVIIKTLRENARIEIGDDCGLSGTSVCAAIKISMGKQCLIGANVAIFDTDFHTKAAENRRYCKDPDKISAKPVTIEDNVFIGTNSIVSKGVIVGENSIIGAGSVVVKNVSSSKIYAGNPAKEISYVS